MSFPALIAYTRRRILFSQIWFGCCRPFYGSLRKKLVGSSPKYKRTFLKVS